MVAYSFTFAPQAELPPLPVEVAYARHSWGMDRYGHRYLMTQLYRDPGCEHWLLNLAGHAPDGHLERVQHHGRAYRLIVKASV